MRYIQSCARPLTEENGTKPELVQNYLPFPAWKISRSDLTPNVGPVTLCICVFPLWISFIAVCILTHFSLHLDTCSVCRCTIYSRTASTDSLHYYLPPVCKTEPMINKIALVLRMLYLSDLHDLSIDINSLLVLVQEYTANP